MGDQLGWVTMMRAAMLFVGLERAEAACRPLQHRPGLVSQPVPEQPKQQRE